MRPPKLSKKTLKELSPIERVIVFAVGLYIVEQILLEMLKKKAISHTEKAHIGESLKEIRKATKHLPTVIAAYCQLGKFGRTTR